MARVHIYCCCILLQTSVNAFAWVSPPSSLVSSRPLEKNNNIHQSCSSNSRKRLLLMTSNNESDNNNFDDLMDMDVILFSRNSEETELGAMQEDGTVAPLSAWTIEPAYDTSLEFVVDEEDRFPGLTEKDIVILSILDENMIGYGSRQVGGGKGPGNPHGEESEMIYYVNDEALEDVEVVIKPELLIDW
mmetsp:Transcript_1036/g.1298  ORF Transcript_1036/g.1298 Transcript_1036/m.1298 type:complete len:189 (+) Transcript_1036:165-731(+)